MWTVGLDVHAKSSVVCVLDHHGKHLQTRQVRGGWDPQRFSRMRTIGSYFGVVPCQDQSAGSNHLGHITRSGPPTVRRLPVEAAWQSIRRSVDARDYFERIMRGDPDRKKIAVVATAHRLVRVMLAMLRSGQARR